MRSPNRACLDMEAFSKGMKAGYKAMNEKLRGVTIDLSKPHIAKDNQEGK